MLFPGVRRRAFHVPHSMVPFTLGICAIFLTLIAWILLAPSNLGNEHAPVPVPDVSSIQSIAYTVPGPEFDDLVVAPASGAGAPRVVASFPNSRTGYNARGAASPLGDEVAVLWHQAFALRANLSVVDLASGNTRDVDGTFDSLSGLSWSPDGTRIAVTSTVENDGVQRTTVLEVDSERFRALPVAEFEGTLEVAPVGFSFDSQRLFIVVVDQRGSNLFSVRDSKSQFVAELSPGRTRDWALSPDGARLAFVDVLGAGSRTYVGRTLVIATGAITTLPAEKNHVGASWMPGSALPSFGGPGGSWQLTDPAPDAAYIVPDGWSPDSTYLVATVYSAGSDRASRPSTALELIARETSTSESTRRRISEAAGAAFLGWVRNLN